MGFFEHLEGMTVLSMCLSPFIGAHYLVPKKLGKYDFVI